ncbi:hypothetical protein MHAE_11446 [Mycobacterium haemophilum DSM 44634]
MGALGSRGHRRLHGLFARPNAWRVLNGFIAATMIGLAVAVQ